MELKESMELKEDIESNDDLIEPSDINKDVKVIRINKSFF